MKEVTIKVREFDPGMGLEFMAPNYPESGVYYIPRMSMYYFVAKEMSLVSMIAANVFEQALKPIDATPGIHSGISANDLIKILAVTAHRDAAVAALAA